MSEDKIMMLILAGMVGAVFLAGGLGMYLQGAL